MRRIALTAGATALGILLLVAAKPHHTGSAAAAATGSASGADQFTGAAAETQYGPLQLQVTVHDGRLTAVTVLQQPNETENDFLIDSHALPILTKEALAAQSAKIHAVSGATYTSQGYITSLQSALDAAKR